MHKTGDWAFPQMTALALSDVQCYPGDRNRFTATQYTVLGQGFVDANACSYIFHSSSVINSKRGVKLPFCHSAILLDLFWRTHCLIYCTYVPVINIQNPTAIHERSHQNIASGSAFLRCSGSLARLRESRRISSGRLGFHLSPPTLPLVILTRSHPPPDATAQFSTYRAI